MGTMVVRVFVDMSGLPDHADIVMAYLPNFLVIKLRCISVMFLFDIYFFLNVQDLASLYH